MARSYRKVQIFDCPSLRPWKADAVRSRRTLRRKAKEAVALGEYDSYVSVRETDWAVVRDGRMWVNPDCYDDYDSYTGRSEIFRKFMGK